MDGPNEVRLGPKPIVPSDPQAKAASPALTRAQQKAGNGSRRAGWRRFGEYIFLEDSRYASQQEFPAPLTAARRIPDPLLYGLERSAERLWPDRFYF